MKSRALTEILATAGSKTIEYNGKSVAGKRVLASLLWEAATTGKTVMPSGAELQLAPNDWFAIVRMLYSQIDGPPPQSVDLTSKGERITGFVNVSPEDWEKGDDAA